MLDLDPSVQLEEEEVAAVEHELGRAGAHVADRARERHRRVADRRAQLGIEGGGGRLLEHLLVAPLHRAVPLAEREHGPVRVREQLDLDVARPLEIALAEDRAVAERGLRLAGGGRERLFQRRPAPRTTRIPRPPPPAAALTTSGKPSSAASPVGTTGTPASPAIRFAASLSPPSRSASGGGPTHVSPAAPTASAKSAFSARKP